MVTDVRVTEAELLLKRVCGQWGDLEHTLKEDILTWLRARAEERRTDDDRALDFVTRVETPCSQGTEHHWSAGRCVVCGLSA